MKRILAIAICVILLCTMSVTAFADSFNLGKYGQKTVTLSEKASPVVDGNVGASEYAWSYEAVLENDASDDNFFVTRRDFENAKKASTATFYISSDADNVYFACVTEDSLYTDFEALYIQISATDDTSKYLQFYVPMGNVEVLSHSNDKANWSSYYNKKASLKSFDLTGNFTGTKTEISVSRSKIQEIFGASSLDKLLVSMAHRIQYDADTKDTSMVVWGFLNDELVNQGVVKHPASSAYPHVVKLTGGNSTGDTDDTKPETDPLPVEPENTTVPESAFELEKYGQKTVTLASKMTPLVDGNIEDGEYTVEIPAMIANDASDDNFFVYGNKAVISDAEGVTFYIAADNDNIYFAVKQKDPSRTGHIDALYLQVGAANDTAKYIQIYLPYNAAYEVLTQRGNRDVWPKYVDLYSTSYLDDITIYEISMPRSIICEEFGIDSVDKLLVSISQRMHQTSADGLVAITWGFTSMELANSQHTLHTFPANCYPNIVKLYSDEALEDDTIVTEPVEMEPVTNDSSEAEPVIILPANTEPATDTEPLIDPVEKGCGASLVSSAVILIVALGICIIKRKEN